jgi:two-component system OmpR family sensor kinase
MSEADELRKINQELRDAIRARDEFLAIAAHELRNPMHALLLQVASALAIARRSGDDELIQRLERVKLVLDRYIKRATLLLEVSRLNAGGAELRFEDLDIAEVLRDLVDTYSVEADFHRVSIQVSAPDSLCGQWDRLAIEQVIGNLLSNAIKYGDGHPITVTLACDTAAARLTVQDRGIGISPENQARIFGRFEQVVTEHPRTGFGVGLWLAHSLMEAHRGSITVSSTPGQGSVFAIWLPLNPASEAAETT